MSSDSITELVTSQKVAATTGRPSMRNTSELFQINRMQAPSDETPPRGNNFLGHDVKSDLLSAESGKTDSLKDTKFRRELTFSRSAFSHLGAQEPALHK